MNCKYEIQKRLELRHKAQVVKEIVSYINDVLDGKVETSGRCEYHLGSIYIAIEKVGIGDRPFGQGCEERIRRNQAGVYHRLLFTDEHHRDLDKQYCYLDYHYIVDLLAKVAEELSKDDALLLDYSEIYPEAGNFTSYTTLRKISKYSMPKAKHDCNKGCPPDVDMRKCKKALAGQCPFLLTHGGTGLYFEKRQKSLFE